MIWLNKLERIKVNTPLPGRASILREPKTFTSKYCMVRLKFRSLTCIVRSPSILIEPT